MWMLDRGCQPIAQGKCIHPYSTEYPSGIGFLRTLLNIIYIFEYIIEHCELYFEYIIEYNLYFCKCIALGPSTPLVLYDYKDFHHFAE